MYFRLFGGKLADLLYFDAPPLILLIGKKFLCIGRTKLNPFEGTRERKTCGTIRLDWRAAA